MQFVSFKFRGKEYLFSETGRVDRIYDPFEEMVDKFISNNTPTHYPIENAVNLLMDITGMEFEEIKYSGKIVGCLDEDD